MHRLIVNLSVAVLTFVIGSLASLLFYGVSPSNENARGRAILVSQSETLAIGRNCHHDSVTSETELKSPIAGVEVEIRSVPPLTVEGDYPPSRFRPTVKGGILNGKAISLPKPVYLAIGKAAHADGAVVVQITIDEDGNVENARAVSGHPLLQSSAVQAAYQARFPPTQLSGQPVRVTGVLVYNFISQ